MEKLGTQKSSLREQKKNAMERYFLLCELQKEKKEEEKKLSNTTQKKAPWKNKTLHNIFLYMQGNLSI